MKLRATKKEMRDVVAGAAGYCQLQYLLYHERAFAYSAGVYGWSCDYYDIDGVIISTGYAPIGRGLDYDTVKKYNDKANKILNNGKLNYNQQRAKVKKLVKQFADYVRASKDE